MAKPGFDRPGWKLVLLGFLALLFALPLAHVHSLVSERQMRSEEVKQELAAQWGALQTIAPAFIERPCAVTSDASSNFDVDRCERRIQMPDRVTVRGKLVPTLKERGLFRVIVYRAELDVSASFDANALRFPASPHALPPRVGFALTDLSGIQSLSAYTVDGVAARPESSFALGELPSLTSPLAPSGETIELRYSLALAGSDAIRFVPVARQTDVALAADWPTPSFHGEFLPATQRIADGRFDASWQVPDYSRSIPNAASESQYLTMTNAAFGVSFFDAQSVYRQNDRSTKYGLLVVALIFSALFLFEVVVGVRMHPVQYVLVGLALATFYVLLLAVSEHLGFGAAYLVASLVAVALVTAYASTSLRSPRRGFAVGALQAGAYGVFYILVANETYALLLGACTLFVVIAVAMYLTRRVDWYGGEPVAA